MPEAKNTFLKAKMNKDLDDRLLPNGEYRDAQNVLVGKSEEDNVGTLQNIRGNALLIATNDVTGVYGIKYIIGYFMDKTNSRIYTFVTDWDGNENSPAPSDAFCAIRFLDTNNPTQYRTLVSGSFLNFSTENPILSVNLLENLLFFTDNRNQPRKINVDLAEADPLHYYEENHISVAKYNPYEPISLIKEEIEDVISVANTTTFDIAENANINAGMTVLGISSTGASTINPNEYIKVISAVASSTPGQTTVTISNAPSTAITTSDTIYFLESTMTDKSDISTWPGDPDYLEDKFVRFAYRFKFEDNEYSIFSPFTQIAYIPKQNGYFINGQENSAVSSTILDWFENGINNIELIVPLPDKGNNLARSYKVSKVEILYSESDETAVKVIDSIDVTEISSASGNNNYYSYSYQSRKPIRTLPQAQTVRVFDKVPVKAKTQEVVSNRVIYGNFQTKHTPPSSINYSVNIEKKIAKKNYTNFVEFPNHTIKQNRNYQVGFVLSDKYGRQSDVILSPVSDSTIGTTNSRGSTIYASYIKDDPEGSDIPDPTFMPNGVKDWFGNSVVALVNSSITGGEGQGAPGLYASPIGASEGFAVKKSTTTTITDTTYTFTLSDSSSNVEIPTEGSYLRGEYMDYVKVTNVSPNNNPGVPGTQYVITTDGRVNSLYLADTSLGATVPDLKFAYNINTLGWYSYKIVVKQIEQDYYNVYLPSAVGATDLVVNSTDTSENVSYISLINDNINKIPRDLAEVGPDQKQYRSSVELFGRVNPTVSGSSPNFTYGNKQYFPLRTSDTSTAIGNADDLLGDVVDGIKMFFKYESDPILARITTNKQFGIDSGDFETSTDRFQLAVYETEPVVSALDIYWETSSVGLISDLNWDVRVGFDGPVSINPTFSFEEQDNIGTALTQDFYPLNSLGSPITNTTPGNFTVTSPRGDVTADFNLIQNTNGSYKITNQVGYTFRHDSKTQDVFTFDITFNEGGSGSSWGSQVLSFTDRLTNNEPSFSIATPNPYYFYDDTYTAGQVIHDFGAQADSVNGASTDSNQTQDLKWTIESGNTLGYFEINATSGQLKLTTAGLNSGNNSYPLVIRLTDATLNGGTPGQENQFFEQTITVIKGYPQSSSYNSSIADESFTSQSVARISGQPTQTFYDYDYMCCYISDSTITNSNLPNFDNNGSFPGGSVTYPCGGLPSESRNARRIGGSQSTGEFVFGIEEAQVEYFGGICQPQPSGTTIRSNITLRVYHTTAASPTSSDWTRVADINGNTGIDNNNNDRIVISPQYYDGTGSGSSAEHHVYFAGATPGKYAFLIKVEMVSSASGGGASTFNTTFTARLRDLHYINSNQTRDINYFRIFTNGTAGFTSDTNACASSSGSVTKQADNPFADYVREWFDDVGLVTVYTPPSANKYYGIERTNTPLQKVAVKLDAEGQKIETVTPPYATICGSTFYPTYSGTKLFP